MTTAQVVETSVTVNNIEQSYSGLRSLGRSKINSTYFWNDSWVQTFHTRYSIKFTLNNAKKCPYQRQMNMLCSRFKDLLSATLRTNLPAGHSMQLLASEEA